jgi:hypothetical protein
MKSPLHRAVVHNFGLKVLAVGIAVVLWLLVTRGISFK